MSPASNLRAVGDRIEELVGELRSGLDPVSWRRVEEALSLVTDLYGGGLAAVLGVLKTEECGAAVMTRLLEDELVSSLLVLHGLHPHDLNDRVQQALVEVRPYLGSHGGDVEVLEIDAAAGIVRLSLLGSCDGCPSSSATLRFAVERAIREAAPEITTIEVDGLVDVPEPEPPPRPATTIELTTKPRAVAASASQS